MKTVTVRPTTAGDELVDMAKKEPVRVRDQEGCTFAIVQVDEADFEAWSLVNNPDFGQMIAIGPALAHKPKVGRLKCRFENNWGLGPEPAS